LAFWQLLFSPFRFPLLRSPSRSMAAAPTVVVEALRVLGAAPLMSEEALRTLQEALRTSEEALRAWAAAARVSRRMAVAVRRTLRRAAAAPFMPDASRCRA
jgi:hypothetical protein